jgi:hypothetical protein
MFYCDFVWSINQIVIFQSEWELMMIFLISICRIFFHLESIEYSLMIFTLNSSFISIKIVMNNAFSFIMLITMSVIIKASSSSESNEFSSFSLASRNKTSDTMCCLSDLCLMMMLNRWIYSKARTSRRFNLSMKLIISDVCLTILKAASWFVKKIVDFLNDSIMWRIFLMIKTIFAIFSFVSQ